MNLIKSKIGQDVSLYVPPKDYLAAKRGNKTIAQLKELINYILLLIL